MPWEGTSIKTEERGGQTTSGGRVPCPREDKEAGGSGQTGVGGILGNGARQGTSGSRRLGPRPALATEYGGRPWTGGTS